MHKRILVIEDDADILQVIKTVLTHYHYEVVGINRTNNIVDTLYKYNPDIVITDYLLNGLNGGKICQEIKRNPITCHIPVVLITAFNDLASLHGNFGFDAFINKPFEIDELIEVIGKLKITKARQT